MNIRIQFVILLLAISLPGCVNVVQKQDNPKKKSEIQKASDDLAIADQAMKSEEAKYKHIKRTNPDPEILITKYHLKTNKDITYFTVTVKNNSKMNITFMKLKWLFYDKTGKEVHVNNEQWGTGGENIEPGKSYVETWTFEPSPSVKTAKISLAQIRFSENIYWDYE
jgi:PBP1b-binding outer membrane lipoprotein LpoB